MKLFEIFGNILLNDNGVGKKIDEIEGKASKASANIGKTINTVAKWGVALAGAGVVAFKMASDYEESLNKVSVAFKSNANEVVAWSKTSLKEFGMASGTALEMTSLFGDMAVGLGLSTKEASKMSISLGGLAGDLSSYKNITLDVSKNALKGIFTGETESLKGLGIVMNDTILKEYALSTGIRTKYTEMSQSEKVQLRYNYVMSMTKDAQGDFARTSDGSANSARIFTESLKELSTTFGQKLLPIFTPIIQGATKLVEWFTKLDGGTQNVILALAGIVVVGAPTLILIGKMATGISTLKTAFSVLNIAMLTNLATKAKDKIETGILMALYAKDAIVKGASAVATGVMTVATTAWNIVCGIATGVTTAFGVAVAFLTSPIGLVILAIGAVIAIGVLLYKNWDSISAKASEVGEKMAKSFAKAGEDIKSALTKTMNFTKENWKEIGLFIVNPISGAIALLYKLNPDFKKWVDGMLKSVKDWWKDVKTWWKDRLKDAKEAGANFIQGLLDGAKSKWTDFKKWISDSVNWWKEQMGFETSVTVNKSTTSSASRVDGSHKNGLDYVPYDGYRPIVHEGEGILTKEKNAEYQANKNNNTDNLLTTLISTVNGFAQQIKTSDYQKMALDRM